MLPMLAMPAMLRLVATPMIVMFLRLIVVARIGRAMSPQQVGDGPEEGVEAE